MVKSSSLKISWDRTALNSLKEILTQCGYSITMNETQTILKVKDTSLIMVLVIGFCIFPIVFFLLVNALSQNYLLAILTSLLVCIVVGILFFRRLKRDEEIYALSASAESITIRKHGTFQWDEISSIKTSCEVPIGRRSAHKYLEFNLTRGNTIILDASNYDIDYIELKNHLQNIKSNYMRKITTK